MNAQDIVRQFHEMRKAMRENDLYTVACEGQAVATLVLAWNVGTLTKIINSKR